MHTLFLIAAVAGGSILVIQVALLMLGLDQGGEVDVPDVPDVPDDIPDDVPDGDVDAGGYEADAGEGSSGTQSIAAFKFLSFKTLVAFFTFFGLTGLLGESYELTTATTLTLAICSGFAAFYLVGYMWMMLYRLESSGNVKIRNAVGTTGRVYLSIPSGGRGKVTLTIQGRTVEYNALTDNEEPITTGASVRVVSIIDEETVKVAPDAAPVA
ncbi:MAG: hypothetical protein AAF517_05750 [Planctomycetota bacterium]